MTDFKQLAYDFEMFCGPDPHELQSEVINILTILAQATTDEPEQMDGLLLSRGMLEYVRLDYADFHRNENLRKTLRAKTLEKLIQVMMGRLADLLDDDDFNNIEALVLEEDVPYPPEIAVVVKENERLKAKMRNVAGWLNNLCDPAQAAAELLLIAGLPPSSAPAEPVKATRLYGKNYDVADWNFTEGCGDEDTHYIDIADDGAIVGGKIASGEPT